MMIEVEKLRCGEYFHKENKIEIKCSEIEQALNEKRFMTIPFHDFAKSLNNDIKSGAIKENENEEAKHNYHTERIAYLIEEQKWKEPIFPSARGLAPQQLQHK